MDNLKERHGCVSAWLWLAIISNVGYVIYYIVSMFNAFTSTLTISFGLLSMLATLNALGAILLMLWNKCGFYLFVISSVIATIINLGMLNIEPLFLISGVIAIIVWWSILQIRKNGKSAWSLMVDGWDYSHRRHMYQLFAAVIAVLFVLTAIAYAQTDDGNSSLDAGTFDDKELYETPIIVDDEVIWKTFYGDSNSCSIEAPNDMRYAELSEDQTLGLICTDYDPSVVVVYETISSMKNYGVNSAEDYANIIVKMNRNIDGSSGYKKISGGVYGDNSYLITYNITLDGTAFRINTLSVKTKNHFYYCQIYCIEQYADKLEPTIIHMIDSFKPLK